MHTQLQAQAVEAAAVTMERMPAPLCFNSGVHSSLKKPPKMELPPRPVPVGSPPWIMKSWKGGSRPTRGGVTTPIQQYRI
jgi:hypothetical protein